MSEFGSGFITCLLQFVYHEPRLYEWDMRMRITGTNDGVWLWADGAKDHLYELKKPPKVTVADWKSACQVRDTVCGWSWSWPFQDRAKITTTMAREMLDQAKTIIAVYGGSGLFKGDPELKGAIAIDHKLGLKHVDTGDAATCTKPIEVDR